MKSSRREFLNATRGLQFDDTLRHVFRPKRQPWKKVGSLFFLVDNTRYIASED